MSVEPTPENERRCKHGEAGSHWYNTRIPTASEIRHARLTDVGTWRKWCAGPMSTFLEPWRSQLEFQMSHPSVADARYVEQEDGDRIDARVDWRPEVPLEFIKIDVTQVPEIDVTQAPSDEVSLPGPLRYQRLTDDELDVVQRLKDAVAERGEAVSKKWGETLTLAMSVEDSWNNFTPLGWIGWGEVHWYADTPIYDALVAERGDPL